MELRVITVIRQWLNQIMMNSFCYKLFPPTPISQTLYNSVCIDSCFPLYSRKWQFFDVMLAESSRHCNARCVLWVFSLTVLMLDFFVRYEVTETFPPCNTWSILVLSTDIRWVSMCGTRPFCVRFSSWWSVKLSYF